MRSSSRLATSCNAAVMLVTSSSSSSVRSAVRSGSKRASNSSQQHRGDVGVPREGVLDVALAERRTDLTQVLRVRAQHRDLAAREAGPQHEPVEAVALGLSPPEPTERLAEVGPRHVVVEAAEVGAAETDVVDPERRARRWDALRRGARRRPGHRGARAGARRRRAPSAHRSGRAASSRTRGARRPAVSPPTGGRCPWSRRSATPCAARRRPRFEGRRHRGTRPGTRRRSVATGRCHAPRRCAPRAPAARSSVHDRLASTSWASIAGTSGDTARPSFGTVTITCSRASTDSETRLVLSTSGASERVEQDRLDAADELGREAIAWHIDEAREEPAELVSAHEQSHALALLEAEDAHRGRVQLVLADLEQLVARERVEDRAEVLPGMRVAGEPRSRSITASTLRRRSGMSSGVVLYAVLAHSPSSSWGPMQTCSMWTGRCTVARASALRTVRPAWTPPKGSASAPREMPSDAPVSASR